MSRNTLLYLAYDCGSRIGVSVACSFETHMTDLARSTYSIENGHRMRQRKHGIGSEGPRVRKGEHVAVWPRLRRSRCAIQRTLQRSGKMRILLQRDGGCQQGQCVRADWSRERTKKSSWLPVRTTLQPRHLRLGAFLPPSTKSSFRLNKPTLVIFRLEIGGRSFFFGGSTKVLLLMVGRSGEPKTEGLGDSISTAGAFADIAGDPTP